MNCAKSIPLSCSIIQPVGCAVPISYRKLAAMLVVHVWNDLCPQTKPFKTLLMVILRNYTQKPFFVSFFFFSFDSKNFCSDTLCHLASDCGDFMVVVLFSPFLLRFYCLKLFTMSTKLSKWRRYFRNVVNRNVIVFTVLASEMGEIEGTKSFLWFPRFQ